MKLLVHDYSGHPFQVQLSRHLAARGHNVTHLFFSEFQTPRGDLEQRPTDPPNFRLQPVSIGRPFAKTSFIKRRKQEIQVGAEVAKVIAHVRPEIVLSANAPLDTQKCIIGATRQQNARFFFWLQDIYSTAITAIITQKFGPLGRITGGYYRKLETGMLAGSDGIIAISDDFLSFLEKNGVRTKATVIENWAPLDSFAAQSSHLKTMRDQRFRFLYSGTLGYKHDPDLLLSLAENSEADIHVHTEGPAAKYLQSEAQRRGLSESLRVSPWVPFNALPSVLAGADALIAMVGKDAGCYSVPSKVLTYLCAGKPLLLSVPSENLTARIVHRENAGLISAPDRIDEFLTNALRLQSDPELCAKLGKNGLAYAQRTFNIERITDRFEALLKEH
jgi:colanic acid biosynthesis glycosyl transferase WcaI